MSHKSYCSSYSGLFSSERGKLDGNGVTTQNLFLREMTLQP